MQTEHGLVRFASWMATGRRFEIYCYATGSVSLLAASVAVGFVFSGREHGAVVWILIGEIAVCLGNLGVIGGNLRRMRAAKSVSAHERGSDAATPAPADQDG